ncbi:uncharacterized protein O9250_005046 isoform 2-T3 [Rhynochetos jubatus]
MEPSVLLRGKRNRGRMVNANIAVCPAAAGRRVALDNAWTGIQGFEMACLYAWFHCMVPQTALPAWSRANSSAQGWGEERLPELMLLPTEMSGAGAKQSGSQLCLVFVAVNDGLEQTGHLTGDCTVSFLWSH